MTKTPHPAPPRDLRETLVIAGIDLLQEGGVAGLTLRKCAARAGVSHAAPAHHFGRIEGLFTAIAARGYAQLTDLLQQRSLTASDNARARLCAICTGYLDFAAKHPALYALMFDSDQVDFRSPDLGPCSLAAFQVLADCCAPLSVPDSPALSLEMTLWSALHGYSALTKKRRDGGKGHPANAVPFDQIFDIIVPAERS